MTSAGAFRLVIGLVLTGGGLGLLFTGLEPIFNGPPLYMTAVLVVVASGMVLMASAFWTLGRPPDLPTGRPVKPPAVDRSGRRVAGRAAVFAAAVGVVVVLALLGP